MPDTVFSAVPVRAMLSATRRLDASSYLRDGKGLRDRFSLLPRDSCTTLGEIADTISQPSRTGTYPAAPDEGYPFLTAGQVFEAHPIVRKWAAKAFVKDEPEREVTPDMLLMSCSGNVGRVTAVYPHHERKMVTHDLLRISIADPVMRMWAYAWLKTALAKSMAGALEYGHIIEHIDPASASMIPVPLPEGYRAIGEKAQRAVELRRKALGKDEEAEWMLDGKLGLEGSRQDRDDVPELSANIADIMSDGRRLDASYFAYGGVREAERAVRQWPVSQLGEVFSDIDKRPRFKRYYSSDESGTPYCSADEIFDVNAQPTKRVYAGLMNDEKRKALELHEGMLVMTRSGQTYGLLGRVKMLSKLYEGVIGTDDLIRLLRPQGISPAYVITFLNSEKYGVPLVKRNAYGTSVPHLDSNDIARVPVPRLGEEAEQTIAETMRESIRLSDEADAIETEAVNEAQSAALELLDG